MDMLLLSARLDGHAELQLPHIDVVDFAAEDDTVLWERMGEKLLQTGLKRPTSSYNPPLINAIIPDIFDLCKGKHTNMASAPHGVSHISTSPLGLRPTLDLPEQHATMAKEKSFSHQYQQTTRKLSGEDTTLADVVNSLARRGSDDLTGSRVSDTDYASLLEWIRCERMSKLPPEGSRYDKALVWAALFIERVHSFDIGIEQFAGDSHLAAQLSYGYCASLLELGEENAPALMDLFGFFYRCSAGLGNLLDREELFVVSPDIKDQLILALADLVTLVVCVARHFHRSLLASELVSIDIYSTFPGPIDSFRGRCEHVSELMWHHQLTRDGLDVDRAVGISVLRDWLQPEDPVVAHVTEATAPSAQEREEATCMWVKPYLTRFLKGEQQVLSITGKPGSGKTVLSTVINDYLQYSVGGTRYMSILAPINGRIPANTTPSAVAKTIMSQMFKKRIGNLQLYQILADAYNQSKQTVDEESYDDLLWNALGGALQSSTAGTRELVLVVDGVDEASCGEKALLRRLQETASKAPSVKLIILASQAMDSVISQTVLRVTLGLLFDDIAAVVRKVLHQSHAYNSMSSEDKEVTVDRLTEASDGSFLWAKLAAKRVRDEHLPNEAALSKSVEGIVRAGYKISDLISYTLQSKLADDPKKILVWLATANRPLTRGELAALLTTQPDKAMVTEHRNVDLPHLLKPVASLVFFHNNLVYLRHAQVRTAIIDVFFKGKFLPEIKDRCVDFAQRLLLYTKQTVTDNNELSLDPLNGRATEHLFEKHPLLDFALRYWAGYVKIAFGCTNNQELTTASKSLRSVFPTSSSVPLLEMTLWASKATPLLRSIYGIQTALYRQILNNNHQATLQAIICQVLFNRQICNSVPAESSRIFYEAAKISEKVLSVRHLITMQMTRFFLEATVDQITESKTEVMTRRIEMLQLMVECQKVHHGATSDMVKSTLRQLSGHYTLIKEDHKAQEINASLDGSFVDSRIRRSGSRQIEESLLVHLHGRKHTTPETSTVLDLDGIEADELITLTFDLKTLLAKAERQRAEGHLAAAECTYAELWQQTSQAYRLDHSTEHKVSMLQTVLEYAQYLKGRKRDNEAAAILAGFWEEYETTTPSAESLVPHLLELAQVMKSVGLSVLALETFKHCAQSTSSQSATRKEVEKHIQSTSQEVMHSSSTNSLLTESTLKEIVYSSTSSDQDSTSATTTLVEMYLSQHRWHDATRLLKRVLRDVWPAMFAPSIDNVVLPSIHVEYCVELAGRLASCYRYRRRPIKEEDIRSRLYSAVRRDRPACGDQILERVTVNLLRLYERTSQTDKAVKIHQDILHDYTKRFGQEHPTVIQKLWTLAELTSPQPIAVDYYRQIVQFLCKGSEICHPDAFEPLLIVAMELLKQNQYADALKPCRMLFATLQSPQVSQKLRDPGFVQTIYRRYVHCLRETHSDITVIHDVTVQYRKSCISLFGTSASITIQATNTLANICQEHKQFEAEAVQLYEELLQITSSEVEIDRQDIRTTLDTIYEQQAASVTASKVDSMSEQELQKALSIRTQRLTSIRSKYGWAHEESLSQMEEIVSLYTKQGKSQTAASLLHEAAMHVLSTETFSIKLSAAAKSIASGYIAAGQIQKAKELSNDIYLQIITKATSASGFDQSSKGRLSLVFLAQLEYSIQESEDNSTILNEIYAALTTEYIYFEQFQEVLGSKTSKIKDTTTTVARLHAFLLSRGRQSAATQVAERYTSFFLASEGSRLDVDPNQAKVFIEAVLEYFGTHTSHDFVRSVAIASYNRVTQLLHSGDYQPACHLTLAATKYIGANDGYSSQAIVKLVFKLGLLIAGREKDVRSAVSAKKYMASVSATILRDTLKYFKDHNVELAQLDVKNVNSLIKVLDEQRDYHTLAWVLTSLWNSRQARAFSQPQHAYTLALGRMLVITHYLISDYTAAVRLAEDLVYNCARVHGPRHPSTVEMTVLLSQMYTSVAQGYQSQKGRRELAYRYYRKAAALHENALRAFIDPSSESASDVDIEVISGMSSPASASSPGENAEEGKHVRQHLHMLKLAVERLGDWPKEYSEYERLNHDLFSTFTNDLEGVDGVDKWKVQSFGSGKAEASDDLISFSHEHLAIPV